MIETVEWVWLDGRKVYELRMAKDWRQSDVTAALARLGVTYGFSQTRISHIETGRDGGTARGVTPGEATALAAVLGVSVWAILSSDPTSEAERLGAARVLVAKLAEVLETPVMAEPDAGEPDGSITLVRLMDPEGS